MDCDVCKKFKAELTVCNVETGVSINVCLACTENVCQSCGISGELIDVIIPGQGKTPLKLCSDCHMRLGTSL